MSGPSVDHPRQPNTQGRTPGSTPGRVIVVTGPPGAGKTTVARLLVDTLSPGVHLHADDFWHVIRHGAIAPYLPEAHRQNEVVIGVVARAAFGYAAGGYDVICDGIIGPWFLDAFHAASASTGIELHYLVLRPDEHTTLQRAVSRTTGDALIDPEPIRSLHHQFTDLDELEPHVLDSSHQDPTTTAEAALRGLTDRRYKLGPRDQDVTSRAGWAWDPTLYAGSAAFYPRGRVAYPPVLAQRLAAALELDGSGRLLDIGCGPGSLTLLLAPLFAEAIGVDADTDMLTEAATQAARAGLSNLSWRHMRAEELPADLPPPTVITFAQSFHWMDRPRVAAIARRMLVEGGALVHVHATTHQGMDTDQQLPHPRPPRAAINALIQQYLGTARRAGQQVLPQHTEQGDQREVRVYRAAGFRGPQRIELPPRPVRRTAEQVRASVYSLSSSAPHLFGARLDAFDDQLRSLLDTTAPEGLFSEQLREITIDIWR